MTDFVLGVGGTGAKCVEAFVRLATCGMGPSSAWVGLLDQDRSNGNSARASQVLSQYSDLRAVLRAAGGSDLGGSTMMGMGLQAPKAGWAWAPEDRSSATLSSSVGYPALPPGDQAVVQALFNDAERRLQLDEGFRQRPALGAALTLQGVTPQSAVWQDLLAAMQAAGHGTEVRVFLMASIFGGTGAAGFPTVARLLRAEIKRLGLEGQVKLGGVLLLPYFSFPPPPPDKDGGPAIRPDSAAFMMQARGALEYYAQLFQAERVFERLYVVGADPLIPLPSYSDGGSAQANPPLLPELVAALAGIDFLQVRRGGEGQTLVAGVSDAAAVGWDDLPFEEAAGSRGLRSEVAATLRAALAWHALYGPALAGDRWQACRREAWFRRMLPGDAAASIGSPAGQAAIGQVTRLFDGLLRWFVALNRGGAGGDRRLALLDDARAAGPWPSAVVDDVSLAGRVDSRAFSAFVSPVPGPSLAEVFERMSYGPLPTGSAGVGTVVAALREACGDQNTRRA